MVGVSSTHLSSSHKRAARCRDRVNKDCLLHIESTRNVGRGTCSQAEVEERRRAVAATGLWPSQRCCRRPPSENSVRLRCRGHGIIKAACQRRTSGAAFMLELTWLGQATRPRARTLGHRRVTSYEATMGGTAYGEHRKAAVGWTEGPTSAASGPLPRGKTRPERVKR